MEGCLHKMLLDALDQDTSCFGNTTTDDNNFRVNHTCNIR